MRVRTKILLLILSFLFTISTILTLSYWTIRQSATFSSIIENGNNLTQDSYKIYSQMKDLVFAGLSPDVYRFIKGYVYMPRFETVYKKWIVNTSNFETSFLDFMNSDELNKILHNVELRDEYNIIMTLSANAFLKIESLTEKFSLIQTSEIITLGKSSYIEFLIQDDEYLDEFLDELQSTSIYLSTNLEGYLQPFFTTIELEARLLQSRIFLVSGIIAILLSIFMTIFAIMIFRRITGQINQVNDYFEVVSTGDFSTQLNIDSNDEFGKLFFNLNKLIADLKTNTNIVIKLMNDIQIAAFPNIELSGVLNLIVKSAVDDTIADSAAILVFDEYKDYLIVEEIEGFIPIEILNITPDKSPLFFYSFTR